MTAWSHCPALRSSAAPGEQRLRVLLGPDGERARRRRREQGDAERDEPSLKVSLLSISCGAGGTVGAAVAVARGATLSLPGRRWDGRGCAGAG